MKWKLVSVSKRDVNFQQAGIVGKGPVPFNPLHILLVYTYGIMDRTWGPNRLRELYTICFTPWSSSHPLLSTNQDQVPAALRVKRRTIQAAKGFDFLEASVPGELDQLRTSLGAQQGGGDRLFPGAQLFPFQGQDIKPNQPIRSKIIEPNEDPIRKFIPVNPGDPSSSFPVRQ